MSPIRKITTTLILACCLVAAKATAQSWPRSELVDSFSVLLPGVPDYQTENEGGRYSEVYISQTGNCFFRVSVLFHALPDYRSFQRLPEAHKEMMSREFVDDYLQQTLPYKNATGTETDCKVGNWYGRELAYTAINPGTGVAGKRFVKAVLVRDKIISFHCWYIKKGKDAEAEKAKFYESIVGK